MLPTDVKHRLSPNRGLSASNELASFATGEHGLLVPYLTLPSKVTTSRDTDGHDNACAGQDVLPRRHQAHRLYFLFPLVSVYQ